MIDDFLPEWERRKRAGGLLDFDDQLWLARDLLFKSKAVRREFQTRYAALLVDEFQDTDAVQWDIVRLLSSADSEEADPARFRPGPGKVFIVGDPKQSIYRFRNADIETYLEIVDPRSMDALGLERLQLTTNFRSVPSILRFVDAAFDGLMKAPSDGCYQPDYLPFGDRGDRTTESSSPAVSLLGEKTTESNSARTVREFLEIEASRIAKLIHQMRGSEAWKIQDSGGGKGSPWRPPRYGDIAVLLPVLSRADILEEALRDMEIPYVLEGGKFYYARSEVSSAITVLRAVANPNDSVALYGALRSIFFGLSDEDLLRAHIEKQPLDYRADVPQQSPLYFPFEILRDLHRHRHDRRASESFEILLQRTGAREVLAVRGFQSLANLNKLGRTLRTLQGEATFSQVVNLLSMMDEEDLAESESRLMEERSDAVRVMSIHRAKGLDFPIVFVASLGLKKRNRTRSLLADFHHKKIFGLSIGSKESGLQTPGWSELSEEEKKRETAELVRLLYVGLTRARDHLVLSTHTQNWKMLEGSDKYVPDTKETRLKPLDSFLERCLSEKSDLIRWVDVDDLDASAGARRAATLPDGRDWSAAVEREYAELHALLDSTPTAESLQPAGQGAGAFDNEDRAHEDRAPEAAATRAIRLGMAFHEAMERVNLNNMDDLDEYAQASGIRHKLDRENVRELERMIRTSWSSDLLERARAATCSGGKVLRELPFVRPLSLLTVEEGKIDLLFEEADGWVLVDYKTDWVQKETEKAEDFFRNKYAAQIQEYIEALRALSVKVQSAYLLLARTGGAVRMI
jgi:ATP-dependent helicase/nuclease subunit A